MGLAGASQKRKISEDPRNTRWATDESRLGFKLLKSMGWKPESVTLNPTAPTPPPRKALTSIPSAKDDMLGLGATNQTKASSVFSAFGSKGLKFVTAGSGEADRRQKTEGGEFASLLDRLNAAAAASASPSPAPEAQEAPVKKQKKRKREQVEEREEAAPVAEVAEPVSAPIVVRNSSRARHLAAKRMASSNASDLAGILGYELPVIAHVAAVTPAVLPAPVSAPMEASEDAAAAKAARKAERKRLKALAAQDEAPVSQSTSTEPDSAEDKAARKAARKAERKAAKAAARASATS